MLDVRTLRGALLVIAMSPLNGLAAECPMQPQTAHERVYCQVWEKGGGSSLPSFNDFRRNSPQVQALLLKRQAARFGIDMPDSEPEPVSEQLPDQLPEAPVSAPMPSTEPSPVSTDVAGAEPPPAASPNPFAGFKECQLDGETIVCPRRRYQLASNLPNSALPEGVLEDQNLLGLDSYHGDPADEAKLHGYLSQAYDRYIQKMLEIGLGGATMSFTQFYHGYQRHLASGVDYAQRLEATFHLLKQDKKTMAVQARLTDKLPQTLEHCEGVGRNIVVCDDVGTNWVFVLQPNNL